MAEIVNLNRFRKARQRDQDLQQAAENRVRFGRTKGEKAADRQAEDRHNRNLDGKALPNSDDAPEKTD